MCFPILLLTLNIPVQIGKGTARGTCNPGWETLYYTNSTV